MRAELDFQIADLARRQASVVAFRQLRALGCSASAIQRAVAGGRFVTIFRGVYLIGGAVLIPASRWIAGLLAAGAGAALRGITAAAARGLLEERGADVHVAVPGTGGRAAQPGLCLHRRLGLEIVHHRGLPTTTVSVMLLDLCATQPERVADKALREADRNGMLDGAELQRTLAGRRGRPGAPRLAALVERHERRAITLTDSVLEDLVLLTLSGLPPPRTQLRVLGRRADFAWPAQGYVLEADGWDAHRDRASFAADRAWDRRLRDHGWVVDRVTHADVVHAPGEIRALVARRLG